MKIPDAVRDRAAAVLHDQDCYDGTTETCGRWVEALSGSRNAELHIGHVQYYLDKAEAVLSVAQELFTQVLALNASDLAQCYDTGRLHEHMKAMELLTEAYMLAVQGERNDKTWSGWYGRLRTYSDQEHLWDDPLCSGCNARMEAIGFKIVHARGCDATMQFRAWQDMAAQAVLSSIPAPY